MIDRQDRIAARRALFVLLAVNAISFTGSTLTYVALPWFVLETTGSAGQAGLTGAAAVLPGVFVGLFGGALVDRFGFRRVSIVADLVSGVGIVLIPLLYRGPGLELWQLLGLVLLGSLLAIPGVAARRSLIPELAKHAGIALERANTVFELTQQAAFLVGPPLAGVLIAWLGASTLLLLDGITFAVSATGVALAVPAMPVLGGPRRVPYLQQVREGLGFFWRERVLRAIAGTMFVNNFLGNPVFAVILPVFARDEFHNARAFGLLFGALGGGEVLGAALFGWRTHRLPRRWMWIGGYLLGSPIFWVLLIDMPLGLLAAVYFALGAIGGHIAPLSVTIRHERIPMELRGRVFSAFSAVAMAAAPLGIAATGFAIEHAGFRPTVLGMAILYQVLSLAMFAVPAFALLDQSRRSATEPV